VDNIHHHHDLEEQYLFPELEKKLGQGALSSNVNEHKEFVPQLVKLKEYMERVKAGEEKYDGQLLIQKIHSFSDIMIAHLNNVRCPFLSPSTLFSSKHRKFHLSSQVV